MSDKKFSEQFKSNYEQMNPAQQRYIRWIFYIDYQQFFLDAINEKFPLREFDTTEELIEYEKKRIKADGEFRNTGSNEYGLLDTMFKIIENLEKKYKIDSISGLFSCILGKDMAIIRDLETHERNERLFPPDERSHIMGEKITEENFYFYCDEYGINFDDIEKGMKHGIKNMNELIYYASKLKDINRRIGIILNYFPEIKAAELTTDAQINSQLYLEEAREKKTEQEQKKENKLPRK